MRWKSLEFDLPRCVQISRPARTTGKGGRAGRDAQYTCRKRLRPSRRGDLDATAKLLGRRALAEVDGKRGSRFGRADRTWLARLCPLSAEYARRGGAARHQQRPAK